MKRFASVIVRVVAASVAVSSIFLGSIRVPLADQAGGAASVGGAGMVIHRDLVTGRLGMPGDLEAQGSMPPPGARSRAEWRQERSAQARGGWRVVGPMLTTMTAHVGADGRLTLGCDTDTHPGSK